MKLIVEPDALKPQRFMIKHDPAVGFYLYVFERDRCVRDHLEDTLDLAMTRAALDYGVAKESWTQTD